MFFNVDDPDIIKNDFVQKKKKKIHYNFKILKITLCYPTRNF